MKRVIIESPYAGDIARNEKYARRCMRDSVMRGEAPFASHLLYTQEGILNDKVPEERRLGMEAGFTWLELAEASIVYIDYGISDGMNRGIQVARDLQIPITYRTIGINDLENVE
jgi:hypothetical protein